MSADDGWIIDNRETTGCAETHRLIRGYASVSFERYLDGLCAPAVYECAGCHATMCNPSEGFKEAKP